MVATRFTAVVFACLLCGCASLSPEEAQRDTALKKFEIQPDVAGVYIYCDDRALMGLELSNVAVDGKPLGQLVPLRYLYTEVAAGPHRVTAVAGNAASLDFDAQAGRNHYVLHHFTSAFLHAGVELRLMTDSEAQPDIALIQYMTPTYREEDLQAARIRAAAAAVLGRILGALPGAHGGASLIGIGMGAPH